MVDNNTIGWYDGTTVYGDGNGGLGDGAITTRPLDIRIVLISVASVGIPANFMTGVVILTTKTMRKKPFNIFILHQTLIDLLACLVTFFLQFFDDADAIDNPVAADIFCKLWAATSLMWTTILASTYNLTCMAIERHQAITRPLKYDELKVIRRIPFVFLIVWVLAFAVFSPNMIFSRYVDGACRANIDQPPSLYKFFFIFWATTTTVIPSTIMIVCYGRMAYFLRESAKAFDSEDQKQGTMDNRQKYMKAAHSNVLQTGVMLAVVYVICWTYLFTIDGLIIYGVIANFSGIEWNTGLALALCNSCVNPFIYSFRYHEFQQALKDLVRRCISIRK